MDKYIFALLSLVLMCCNNQAPVVERPKCAESDSVVLGNSGNRLVFHFKDCGVGLNRAGTIEVSTNKPIFGKKESARIMGTDDVIGLDAVGYGYRLNNESDRRTLTVKYQYSRKAITDTILSIFHSY